MVSHDKQILAGKIEIKRDINFMAAFREMLTPFNKTKKILRSK